MAEENLKNLPAEERLKKLKELEKKKKQEIEEAQKQIKDSESEITEKKKWVDKVPIPEVAQEDLEGLSAEGKQLLKTHKGTTEKPKEEKEEENSKTTKKSPSKTTQKAVSDLEETVMKEKVTLSPQAMGMEYGAKAAPNTGFGNDYKPLRDRPTTDLYQEMNALHQGVESKGYISRADERKAEYLSGIVQERQEAADKGTYTFSEETARAASVMQQLAHNIKQAYKSGTFEHDWYKGR